MERQEPVQDGKTRRSVLRSTIGLTTVGVGAVVYDRMARAPEWHPVSMRIGGDQNAVGLEGNVSVSVLSSTADDFRPTEEIDPGSVTVRFAIYKGSTHPSDATLFENGVSPIHGDGHVKDMNGDGIDDLTFHFDACNAVIEDEVSRGNSNIKARLLLKEGWSLTEKKNGWKGDAPVRLASGICE